VLHADLGVEQAQVVIDLGDRGDGGFLAARLRRCSMATVGGNPARKSTFGRAITLTNWRA